jgi:hypothetical protein
VGAALDLLLCEEPEPAFDLVDPGRAGRGVAEDLVEHVAGFAFATMIFVP